MYKILEKQSAEKKKTWKKDVYKPKSSFVSIPIQMVNGDGYLKYKAAYKSDEKYKELRQQYRAYLTETSGNYKETMRKELITKCMAYLDQDDIKLHQKHKGRTKMVNDLLVKLGPVSKHYGDGQDVFQFGTDVVFGLDAGRRDVMNDLLRGNHGAFRFGMRQNDLTDAVWSPSEPATKYSEAEIRGKIIDEHPELKHNQTYIDGMVRRILGFQQHLLQKSQNPEKGGYDIWKPFNSPERQDQEAIARWKRTSKAGLEYQLCVLKQDVCLAVDGLEIKDIIKGGGSQSNPAHVNSITSGEVRWLYRSKNNPDVRSHLKLYSVAQNKLIGLDEFFGDSQSPYGQANRQLWANYDTYRTERHPVP